MTPSRLVTAWLAAPFAAAVFCIAAPVQASGPGELLAAVGSAPATLAWGWGWGWGWGSHTSYYGGYSGYGYSNYGSGYGGGWGCGPVCSPCYSYPRRACYTGCDPCYSPCNTSCAPCGPVCSPCGPSCSPCGPSGVCSAPGLGSSSSAPPLATEDPAGTSVPLRSNGLPPRTYDDTTPPRPEAPGTDPQGFRRTPTDGAGTGTGTPPRSSSPPIDSFDPGRGFDAPAPRGTTPATPPADDGLFNPAPTTPRVPGASGTGTTPRPGPAAPGGTFDGPTDAFRVPSDPLETPVRPRTTTPPGTSDSDPFESPAPPRGTGTGGLSVPAEDPVAVSTLDLDDRVTSRPQPLRTRLEIRSQFGSPIVQRVRSEANAGWTAVASPSPARPSDATELRIVKN